MAHVNSVFVVSMEKLPSEFDQEQTTVKDLNSVELQDPKGPPDNNGQPSKKMGCFRMNCHWFINTLILITLTGLSLILEFFIVPLKSLGFKCKDPNLSHPFKGDTITHVYLLLITGAVPLICILLVESIFANTSSTYPKKGKPFQQFRFWYSRYFMGILILFFLVEVGKSFVAAPRPHFFDTCKPDKAINCTTEFFYEYKCTNTKLSKSMVNDSIRSFPSGHSALACYTAVFMMWFFHIRIPRSNYITVPVFQCLFLLWGLFCSVSRISDRRHHWWDVLAGVAMGISLAIIVVKVYCKNCSREDLISHRPDKNLNDTGNLTHGWNKKLLSSVTNCSQNLDERELREVK